jgi:general secretion pathway protein I
VNERGFTLLEMLVALAVIGVAALTLVRLDAFAVRSSADLDARTLAQVVAQNEAVTLWTDPAPPTIGTSVTAAENAGRRFRVERRVAPTADANLLRIDLIVRADTGSAQAALTIIRPAR